MIARLGARRVGGDGDVIGVDRLGHPIGVAEREGAGREQAGVCGRAGKAEVGGGDGVGKAARPVGLDRAVEVRVDGARLLRDEARPEFIGFRVATGAAERIGERAENLGRVAFEEPGLMGQRVFFDMKPNGDNRWTGKAFNPEDGKNYSGKVMVNGKQMVTEGCALAGLVCRSVNWVRVD